MKEGRIGQGKHCKMLIFEENSVQSSRDLRSNICSYFYPVEWVLN